MKNITAIVPTRAGSERVKNKNTKPFLNSSLLELKLKSLIKLKEQNLIKDIIVNSDCIESAKIAKKFNISYVPREEKYASSECNIRDYWQYVANSSKTENFMLCQVTSPLISLKTYKECISKFSSSSSILTATKVKEYLWKGLNPINYTFPNHPKSQDLPDNIFKLNFGVCIMSVSDINKHKNLVIPKTHFIYLDGVESVDIDTELDFKIAEVLYKNKNYE